MTYNTESPELVVTSSSRYTTSNGSLTFQNNNYEEADTLMINRASRRNPAFLQTLKLLLLLLSNTISSSKYTGFYCVRREVIDIEPIARALGQLQAHALSGSALPGADTV